MVEGKREEGRKNKGELLAGLGACHMLLHVLHWFIYSVWNHTNAAVGNMASPAMRDLEITLNSNVDLNESEPIKENISRP